MTRRPRKVHTEAVISRDGDRCWLCGNRIDLDLPKDHPLAPSLDHIVPKSRGGSSNSFYNLALSHRVCNESKSDKTPTEFLTNIEGLLYKENGKSALLLTFDSNEELYSVLNKLVHTRNKHLKNIIQNIMRRLD